MANYVSPGFPQSAASVSLWGQNIGALGERPDGAIAFAYAPDWLSSGVEIAPIKMPLQPGHYQFPHLNDESSRGLPGAFTDSLPDDFGEAVIDAWLAREGIPKEHLGPVDRLLYTGTRGIGALEYQPTAALPGRPDTPIELEALLKAAQQVLDRPADADHHWDEEGSLDSLLHVGIAAGGGRPKALVAVNEPRTDIRSGQVAAPEGFTHYLLKFDGVVDRRKGKQAFGDPQGFGRMEYAYYRMATAAGIVMEPCELLEEKGRAHFMTRRFDRDGNHKRHFQSLCALDHADFDKPGHYSYEALFGIARQLRLTREEVIQLYRRMVFNVVTKNHDDHTKNFGFLLDNPDAKWRLAPAFDIAYSYKPGSEWIDCHQMVLNGKRDDFTRDDLLAVANQIDDFSHQAAKKIIEEICDIAATWPRVAAEVDVPKSLTQEIENNMRLFPR